jgi:hypothetical protein
LSDKNLLKLLSPKLKGTSQTGRPAGVCFKGIAIFLKTGRPDGTKSAPQELTVCRKQNNLTIKAP